MMRGFAAFYVLCHHLAIARFQMQGSICGFLLSFGQEAVLLFFLLSGFVVFYSTEKHSDKGFARYFTRRILRIYPIFLLALLLSAVVYYLQPHAQGVSLKELAANLLFLQDFSSGKPGVWFSTFAGNAPLWSLSYEWWFYMMFFPIWKLVPYKAQIHLVAVISIIGFGTYSMIPNQLSLFLMYFLIWWCGAEMAREFMAIGSVSFSSLRAPLVYLTVLVILLAVPVFTAFVKKKKLLFGIHPVLELRHFTAALVFILLALFWAKIRWFGFNRLFGGFALVAPISYALYVFHYPLMVTSSYLNFIPSILLQLIGYLLITFLLAFLAEGPFQKWVNGLGRKIFF